MAAATNIFVPNAEEFFLNVLFVFHQCTACLDLRNGDQAEFLSRRVEHYEETLRVMNPYVPTLPVFPRSQRFGHAHSHIPSILGIPNADRFDFA